MMYVRMYVSVTLRNVAVTSRRNVASMMRICTPNLYLNRVIKNGLQDSWSGIMLCAFRFEYIPYSGKVWWGESLANWASRSFGEGKFGEY